MTRSGLSRAAQTIDQKSEKEDSDDCEIIEMEERKAQQRIVASKKVVPQIEWLLIFSMPLENS